MRSCSLKRIAAVLSALLLVLCLFAPAAVHASAAAAIGTEAELRAAIENASDGAEILVNDIEFASLNDPIVITKSITLRSMKDHGSAIFYGSTFVMDGSASRITVQFDNITFCSTGDAANIMDEFWDQSDPLPPAVSFHGNVNALLTDCVFRNYVSLAGANLSADYADSDAVLLLRACDCSFLGNAVRDRGGAVLLIGQPGRNNVIFTAENCAFTGNLSGNREGALGGGAIYAEEAALTLAGCSFSANEASHQYLLPEPENADGETEAEPAYADYADLTKGGGIYAVDSQLTMSDCRVTQCSASLGGGLALENTEFFFLGGILAHNRAESSVLRKDKEGLEAETGMGGGIFISADRSVTADIINSSFYGNTALNAYGGICFDGADGSALPYIVRLMLCSYAGNSADAAYYKPEVDRSKYFPQEKQESSSKKKSEKEKAEEAKKQAEAEAAYEKAVADALAKAEWTSVPGDVWDTDFLQAQASVIIDESFSSLKRNKVAFPRYEQPGVVNRYTYYAPTELALADGYMPNVPSAEFTHVIPPEAFRTAFPLPDGLAEEIFSPYYQMILGRFHVGDNTGGGLSYQLILDNVLWKTVEAVKVTPVLPVPEKEGHSFDLWQTSDGSPYAEGISFITGIAPQTLQVSAVMHPNTYVLHFNSEAGTQDIQQVYGTPVTLPAPSEKKNYDFVSWYKSDGSLAVDGEIYTVLGDSSYTAQYTKHFPMQTVMILTAAIALILVYLIIARIVDHIKKTKPKREARKAEKAAQKAAEEKRKAEEQARAAQEKARKKAEEDARKKAEAEAKAKAKAEEEARKQAEKEAKAKAKADEKAAREAEKAAKEAGKAAGEAVEPVEEAVDKAAEKAEKAVEAAVIAEEAKDAIAAATAAVSEALAETADSAAEAVTEAAGNISEAAAGVPEEVIKAASSDGPAQS